jgi:hypothetical protein
MGQDVEFKPGTDVHVVSSLMKLYLRQLPEPLLTFDMVLYAPLDSLSPSPSLQSSVVLSLFAPHRSARLLRDGARPIAQL